MAGAAVHEVLGGGVSPGGGVEDGSHVVDIVGFGEEQFAEVAAVQQFLGCHEPGDEAAGLPDQKFQAGAPDEIDGRLCLVQGYDQGLGADNVLAGLQRVAELLEVEVVGAVDADDINVGTVEDFPVFGGLEQVFVRVLAGDPRNGVFPDVADRTNGESRIRVRINAKSVSTHAHPDDPNANRLFNRCHFDQVRTSPISRR